MKALITIAAVLASTTANAALIEQESCKPGTIIVDVAQAVPHGGVIEYRTNLAEGTQGARNKQLKDLVANAQDLKIDVVFTAYDCHAKKVGYATTIKTF